MSQYTPGEWRVAGGGRHKTIRSDQDGGLYIASMSWERDDSEANARLIAAAPELLGALQALGVHPEYGYCFCLNREQQDAGHTGECREARAAIAKVEATP